MADPSTPEPKDPGTPPEGPDPKAKESELEERIRKIAQAEADRVRTEKSQVIRKLEEELELLKKEKMTEKQRLEYENKQRDELLTKREKELFDKENTITANTELATAGLDIAFSDFVKGSTLEQTKGNVAILKAKFAEALGKAVDDKLKGSAHEPAKGRVPSGTSDITGMTAKEIEQKGKADPKWWDKNEPGILDAMAKGLIKRG